VHQVLEMLADGVGMQARHPDEGGLGQRLRLPVQRLQDCRGRGRERWDRGTTPGSERPVR